MRTSDNTFIFRMNEEGQQDLLTIADLLEAGQTVKVINEHETFQGAGMKEWIIKNLPQRAKVTVTHFDKWYGFPNEFIITPAE